MDFLTKNRTEISFIIVEGDKENNSEDLRIIMQKVFTKERLQSLGPNQQKLLVGMVATEDRELNEETLTGIIEEVENGIPERFIESFPSLKPLLEIGSRED